MRASMEYVKKKKKIADATEHSYHDLNILFRIAKAQSLAQQLIHKGNGEAILTQLFVADFGILVCQLFKILLTV